MAWPRPKPACRAGDVFPCQTRTDPLEVRLSPVSAPETTDKIAPPFFVTVAPLKATAGNMNSRCPPTSTCRPTIRSSSGAASLPSRDEPKGGPGCRAPAAAAPCVDRRTASQTWRRHLTSVQRPASRPPVPLSGGTPGGPDQGHRAIRPNAVDVLRGGVLAVGDDHLVPVVEEGGESNGVGRGA